MSNTPETTSSRIHAATAEHHDRLVGLPYNSSLINGEVTTAQLVQDLVQRRALYAALESRLGENSLDPRIRKVFTDEHFKRSILEEDIINSTDFRYGAFPLTSNTNTYVSGLESRNTDPLSLAGAFYVLEKTAKGTRVHDKVYTKLGLDVKYFDPKADAKFTELVGRLDDEFQLDAEQQVIVDGTVGMYKYLIEISEFLGRVQRLEPRRTTRVIQIN